MKLETVLNLRTMAKIKENPSARLIKFADCLANFREALESFYAHGYPKSKLKMYLDKHKEFITNFSFAGKVVSGDYLLIAAATNYLEGELAGVYKAAKVAYYGKE